MTEWMVKSFIWVFVWIAFSIFWWSVNPLYGIMFALVGVCLFLIVPIVAAFDYAKYGRVYWP